MTKPLFLFGDIVVVEDDQIGVIVKTWDHRHYPPKTYNYEVYVRSYRSISEYPEQEIDRYRVRHKELSKEELEWQNS